MNLGKNKIVMFMLLLAFVSQVTAANTVICLMDNQSKVTIEDHSNHNMAEQKDGHHSSQAQQLCSQDNNCSMTGCLAFILPYVSIKKARALSSQDIVIHPVKSVPSQLLTSLYRPPILS